MTKSRNAVTPSRQEDFAQWYQEVIKAADLAEHAAVRGCMVIKPLGCALWEAVQQTLDKMIKDTGHKNVYFPLLIPISFLEKEAEHVEGFAKECAVVTHHRLEINAEKKLIPSPDAELAEPFVIRPTSETVIGQAMSKWIQSYNDLPIKINQWANIMRWEMRTRLFLRTSEFLWQEGHTAHASQEEAREETHLMLNVYEKLVQEFLAIPVIKGEKTPGERFPGAVNTYTIEAMMQDGKALQAGTSHFLGQNFSKAYDMAFLDDRQTMQHAWTTSWGVSTRLIGALIMTHSDDDGLVIPPRIAPEQIRLIPVIMNEADRGQILEYCEMLAKTLEEQKAFGTPIRTSIDRTSRRTGDKFWSAVKEGTPIRIEIGLREIESDALSIYRRDKAAKEKTVLSQTALLHHAGEWLEEMQSALFQRAYHFMKAHLVEIDSFEALKTYFGNDDNAVKGFAAGYLDIRFENDPRFVETMKILKLTTRCMPLDNNNFKGKCIFSGKETYTQVIFGRAY